MTVMVEIKSHIKGCTGQWKRRGKNIILISIAIGIIVVATLLAVTLYNPVRLESYITAKEGYRIAEKVAKERYGDKPLWLNYVIWRGEKNNEGKGEEWEYSFSCQVNSSSYEGFCVRVHSNGKTEFLGPESTNLPPTNPISNWTVDSHTAAEIVTKLSTIKNFLSKYNDARVDHFQLSKAPKYSNKTIWAIYWHSPGFMDNPHNAHVIIDAHTGEILEVEAQMD